MEEERECCHHTADDDGSISFETAKSKYNNGVLEIAFEKKKETKPKGKEIKIE
jgi:HSP20 family protein